ncbi:glycoside hydrolase family 81 protein [Purpureocillium lavendulum]|uniref:Glycoside hydrolase family 81 protein n=1 Tax=Purpureocillium lavendulum TaxID=1247861 RepID=A0AB34FTI3_9HYPO|nr:glycoside hydrolase family 81 protein [Purpureocillium lavendulum]
MSDAPRPEIYPRYCFHLSPTSNKWCLLRASEVHGLDQHAGFEGENFFFCRNLPIKWVRVVGLVVAIDDFFGRRAYTVDDSSGACIEALITRPTGKEVKGAAADKLQPATTTASVPEKYKDIDVGSVVDVKGQVSVYRGEKQITVENMVIVPSTAHEVVLWEKRADFRRTVLDKPWVLSHRELRRCRKDAERSEEDEARKRRRIEATEKKTNRRQEDVEARRCTTADATGKRSKRNRAADDDIRELIRGGALEVAGKYSALGL